MRVITAFLVAFLFAGGAMAQPSGGAPGFTDQNTGTPISVTTGGVTGALPGGTVVIATNVGTSGAYCKLGATATTSDHYLTPGGGSFSFQPNGATQLTCVTAALTTTVNMVGGSGQAAMAASGGGGNGSGGATAPAAGTASAIVTGGSATTLITGPVNGCYITNPATSTDQNIAAAEVAYINPVTTATANGRGTNSALQPGQSWTCPPGQTTNVSAIAATTAHAFNVVKW